MLTRETYTKKYYPIAKEVSKGSGIFPETILSIAIVETSRKASDGNYYPASGKLVGEANNHFGIKADSSWKGDVIFLPTPGDANKVSKFRKYKSDRESYIDFVRFIKNNPRYTKAGVLNTSTWQDQVVKIASAGYAEAGSDYYSNLLKSVGNGIKKYVDQINTNFKYAIPLSLAAVVIVTYILMHQKNTAYDTI